MKSESPKPRPFEKQSEFQNSRDVQIQFNSANTDALLLVPNGLDLLRVLFLTIGRIRKREAVAQLYLVGSALLECNSCISRKRGESKPSKILTKKGSAG